MKLKWIKLNLIKSNYNDQDRPLLLRIVYTIREIKSIRLDKIELDYKFRVRPFLLIFFTSFLFFYMKRILKKKNIM